MINKYTYPFFAFVLVLTAAANAHAYDPKKTEVPFTPRALLTPRELGELDGVLAKDEETGGFLQLPTEEITREGLLGFLANTGQMRITRELMQLVFTEYTPITSYFTNFIEVKKIGSKEEEREERIRKARKLAHLVLHDLKDAHAFESFLQIQDPKISRSALARHDAKESRAHLLAHAFRHYGIILVGAIRAKQIVDHSKSDPEGHLARATARFEKSKWVPFTGYNSKKADLERALFHAGIPQLKAISEEFKNHKSVVGEHFEPVVDNLINSLIELIDNPKQVAPCATWVDFDFSPPPG